MSLSPESAKRAAEELGETPEKLATAPGELRAALVTAADDPKHAGMAEDLRKAAKQNDAWLLRFLRKNKYDVAKSVENVVGYFEWVEAQFSLPDTFFGYEGPAIKTDLEFWSLRAEDIKDLLATGVMQLLPGTDADGRRGGRQRGKILGKIKVWNVYNNRRRRPALKYCLTWLLIGER